MLNEMRLGKISEETTRSFQALSRPLNFNDGLEVTELYARTPPPFPAALTPNSNHNPTN
jgi:hypothetical protein